MELMKLVSTVQFKTNPEGNNVILVVKKVLIEIGL